MEKKTEKILENIRKIRLEKEMSLLNLANMAEISHSHLYYIETKRVIPSIDIFVKIAQALNVELIKFFDD